ERAPGGLTIGEILERTADLAGEQVLLRGKVAKCSRGILGRTWIHLRDGTLGPEGTGDVTVTTRDAAAIGDTVLVRGTIVLDKDFGYGYRYDLLIEDASITIE
ncbi:MAG: DNA-binding protein, partial [Deltaproteobacteria bacterium]|nr:DNA-binding protein [Deltaproteobacteria bacterium]